MSLSEYEDFVYGACHVRAGEDPVAHWREVSVELNARARELETFRELRIVGPDTDLRIDVDGRSWLAADGKLNMPDGEIFTSPVETETEGEIRFSFPAIFHGRGVEDVRLRFEGGRVVRAEAKTANDYLQSLLDMDDGRARPRRARVRPELRDRPVHARHPLRREDRRDDAPRARRELPEARRRERLRAALGHDLRPAGRTARSTPTASSCGRRVTSCGNRGQSVANPSPLPDPHRRHLRHASSARGADAAGRVRDACSRAPISCCTPATSCQWTSSRSCAGSGRRSRVSREHGRARLKETLPKQRVVEVGGLRIGMVHDAGPRAAREARLAARFEDCEAVVYGHTHVPQVERFQHLWVLNPGSPTERRSAAGALDARPAGDRAPGSRRSW